MQLPSTQLLYQRQLHTNWYTIKHNNISATQHSGNDTQRRESNCSEKNLSRGYILKHRSHTGRPKVKPGLSLANALVLTHLGLIKFPSTNHMQGVTGGTDQTSGECSLGHTIPI